MKHLLKQLVIIGVCVSLPGLAISIKAADLQENVKKAEPLARDGTYKLYASMGYLVSESAKIKSDCGINKQIFRDNESIETTINNHTAGVYDISMEYTSLNNIDGVRIRIGENEIYRFDIRHSKGSEEELGEYGTGSWMNTSQFNFGKIALPRGTNLPLKITLLNEFGKQTQEQPLLVRNIEIVPQDIFKLDKLSDSIRGWFLSGQYVEWYINSEEEGEFFVDVQYTCPPAVAVEKLILEINGIVCSKTQLGPSNGQEMIRLGKIKVPEGQMISVRLRLSDKSNVLSAAKSISIRKIILSPVKPVIVKSFVEMTQAEMTEEGWELVWKDEFDSNKLDLTKWNLDYGSTKPGQPIAHAVLKEENVVIENGILKLINKKERAVDIKTGQEYQHTTGAVQTRGKFSYKYGYMEFRIKLPAGPGIQSAYWFLLSEGGSRRDFDEAYEIDIEFYGRKRQKLIGGHVYGGGKGVHIVDTALFDDDYMPDLTSEFHIFGFEWTPDNIVWYIDGKEFERTHHQPHVEIYTILSNYVRVGQGPTWGAGWVSPDTVFPNIFEVDYIRLYQKKEHGSTINQAFKK